MGPPPLQRYLRYITTFPERRLEAEGGGELEAALRSVGETLLSPSFTMLLEELVGKPILAHNLNIRRFRPGLPKAIFLAS